MPSEPRLSQDLTTLPLRTLSEAERPSRDFPALSTISPDERDAWRHEAESAQLIWVEVQGLNPDQRGGLALVIETAIEAALQQRGAGAPGFSSATHLDATLSDQLYRARTLGARGLAIRLRTLASLTNLAGALDADDSSLLRWWMTATRERPVHLIFDARDRYLGVYTRPVALETLLSEPRSKAAEQTEKQFGILTLEPWAASSHEAPQSTEAARPTEVLPPHLTPTRLEADSDNLPDECAPSSLEGAKQPDGEVNEAPEQALAEAHEDAQAHHDVSEAPEQALAEAPEDAHQPHHEVSEAPEQACAEAQAAAPAARPTVDARSASIEAQAAPRDGVAEVLDHLADDQAPEDRDACEATTHDAQPPAHGEARQLAFRSVLAALEAMEQDDSDESPLAALEVEQDDSDESPLAPSAFEQADELTPMSATAEEDEPEQLTRGDTQATDLLDALEVEPSPDGDGFSALLTHDDGTPLPVRPIARLSLFEAPPAPEPVSDADAAEQQPSELVPAVRERAAAEDEHGQHIALGSAESELMPAVREHAASEDEEQRTSEAGEAHDSPLEPSYDLVPESTWRGWVRDLVAARGPKPLAVVERLFASAYVPLQQARRRQPLDASADEALSSWSTAFSKSYQEAFEALRLRSKRPAMVLDVPEVALRHHRLHGARQVQLILVDGLRFDLGSEVHEHLRELAGRDAACVERLLLWSALPATTSAQIELIARGPQGLREPPSSEAPMPVARGRAASTLRRVKAGYRDLMKLDLVESRVTEPHGATPHALSSLSREVAGVLWDHLASLPPRTLVMIFGDHGFYIEEETQSGVCPTPSRGSATPEEILVPAYAWLTGSVH